MLSGDTRKISENWDGEEVWLVEASIGPVWLVKPRWSLSETRSKIAIYRFLKRIGVLELFLGTTWPVMECFQIVP